MTRRRGPSKARFLESSRALPSDGQRQVDQWDGADGLLCCVTSKGRRTFCVVYRWNGLTRRETLRPPFPELSLKAARDKARAVQEEVAAGRDPRTVVQWAEDVVIRAAPVMPSYGDAVCDYVQLHQIGHMQNRTPPAGALPRSQG